MNTTSEKFHSEPRFSAYCLLSAVQLSDFQSSGHSTIQSSNRLTVQSSKTASSCRIFLIPLVRTEFPLGVVYLVNLVDHNSRHTPPPYFVVLEVLGPNDS